ncbi:hypothetical protein Pst134EA_004585 [Puccinia striiformis f. sp. tritici]|uniref:Uncharacterized protein n=3 Tax=Puccinia striiformis TaxID=27350 RepID=A0A0L0VA51_9BASI|nr:hypothetical protein Pst134EA_004585 [Puccinia striiformis f. sp. tritici]KAI9613312.1 hypothetical protein H4Q26_009912 [Puccinia striiformis f. sp. tritici PST-130]KNE96158.1 hypothetical protein PSTG_10576 [Puccinia striiformis f. sp. tritici PST-78]POW00038.1 hypothetical protein PSHT_13272 [Puccinia striiformis]KAH9461721.1 hypothetical protein Pst134EB_005648 [Puccinia striiformis f. sp. tritici]KAH9470658.1 hypothetical protein Pst134EA_004585 [Puccinia striiformis f. sp. tritici]
MFIAQWTRSAIITSAVVALAVLPFITPSELHRRAFDPQQCGVRYVSALWLPDVECTNYGNVKYSCVRKHCYLGAKYDPPSLTNPVDNLEFQNCHEILRKDPTGKEVLSPVAKSVKPRYFFAQNLKGTLQAGDYRDMKEYRCNWSKATDANNVRPWCNICTKAKA